MFKRHQTTLNSLVSRVAQSQSWLRESVLIPVLALPVVALTGQAALADKADFEVINESSEDVVAIFITASYEGSWGESLLDEGGMPSGHGFQVEFNDPSEEVCLYDIRTVFADGNEVEDYGVNVCYHDYYSLVD
ncbi:MAG TPA: hypothetical protein V6D07_16710 [Trichocoleus sp.]